MTPNIYVTMAQNSGPVGGPSARSGNVFEPLQVLRQFTCLFVRPIGPNLFEF
jgi:hypothetical protein